MVLIKLSGDSPLQWLSPFDGSNRIAIVKFDNDGNQVWSSNS
ncbi:hypothetical protein [Winogradskyella sp. PC D3.3]